jgi:hypothetical protein
MENFPRASSGRVSEYQKAHNIIVSCVLYDTKMKVYLFDGSYEQFSFGFHRFRYQRFSGYLSSTEYRIGLYSSTVYFNACILMVCWFLRSPLLPFVRSDNFQIYMLLAIKRSEEWLQLRCHNQYPSKQCDQHSQLWTAQNYLFNSDDAK